MARLIRRISNGSSTPGREARYLFEISRSEWTEEIRGAQRAQNSRLAEAVERWRAPLVERGELLPMTAPLFFSQIIGPAQIFCRAWLSGRDRTDPREQADILIACAIRAVVAPDPDHKPGERMSANNDPDFAPIATASATMSVARVLCLISGPNCPN